MNSLQAYRKYTNITLFGNIKVVNLINMFFCKIAKKIIYIYFSFEEIASICLEHVGNSYNFGFWIFIYFPLFGGHTQVVIYIYIYIYIFIYLYKIKLYTYIYMAPNAIHTCLSVSFFVVYFLTLVTLDSGRHEFRKKQ